MKLYLDDLLLGMTEMLELHKQGSNIFEMQGGSMFPHHTTQSTWEFSKADSDKLHLSDGTHTYSFKGQLSDYDSELERLPEVPLPDMYVNSTSKGKAQVHRSDPGSIYFTLQEGRNNPTYTLKHMGDNKWKAIPKAKKVKQMLKDPVTPHNVNLDYVKQGMLAELSNFSKQGGAGMVSDINTTGGNLVQKAMNLPANVALAPARMGGPVTSAGDQDQNATETFGHALQNSWKPAALGAGAGALYHLAKRHILNTAEENRQEDEQGGSALKNIAIPALAMGGLSLAGRSMFPAAVNNPTNQMFPA